MIRNIYAYEDESPAWQQVLAPFPNHVPRFVNKEEAIEFSKKYSGVSTNPDYRQLQHSVTTLIDWTQIEKYLLAKVAEYDNKWPSISWKTIDLSKNRYAEAEAEAGDDQRSSQRQYKLPDYVRSRLNLPVHSLLSQESRFNTLNYLFFHMKCGIFVMFRNSQLVMFTPFVNKDYENNWGQVLRLDSSDGSLESYQLERKEYYHQKQIEQYLPMSQWWANGNIICNVYKNSSANQYWGDHFLLALKDMFAELARTREIPDCEFFLNKRDYPQLKVGKDGKAVEPYGFIYDKDDRDAAQDVPLTRFSYESYLPIM